MLRKTGLFSVLALVAFATPLHAETHYVVLLDTGYFPDYVYPVPGDQIRFVNEGELAMAATATDLSWSTGDLMPDQDFILDVTEGMKQTFNNAHPDGTPAGAVDAFVPIGVIDYLNPAPVDLGSNGKPLILADEAYGK